MANIKLTLPAEPFSGQIVTFTAPCDCASVTGGIVINTKIYTVCDAMGNKVTGTGGVWCAGAQVSVVLDCENKKAYLQNGNVTSASIGAIPSSGGTQIPSGSFIDYFNSGVSRPYGYYYSNGNTITDMPFEGDPYWYIFRAPGCYYATCSMYPSRLWFSRFLNGNFSGWKRVADTDYAVNKAGDTMTHALEVSSTDYNDQLKVKRPSTGDVVIGFYGTEQKGVVGFDHAGKLFTRFGASSASADSKEILHTGNKSLITPADIGAAAATHTHEVGDITGLESALSSYSKIVTVKYTGTGTHGADNPCSAYVGFKPKYVQILYNNLSSISGLDNVPWWVVKDTTGTLSVQDSPALWYIGDISSSYSKKKGLHINYSATGMTKFGLYSKYSNGTVYWYAENGTAQTQWNSSNTTYHMIFIGEVE